LADKASDLTESLDTIMDSSAVSIEGYGGLSVLEGEKSGDEGTFGL
jgi:hypothetical protein